MYTIKGVSSTLKINANAIRFYEKKNLINPLRGKNGYRQFSSDDIAKLQMIILYRKMGFSIEAIAELINYNGRNTTLEQFTVQYNFLNEHIHTMSLVRETLSGCIEKLLNNTGMDQDMIKSMEDTANIITASNNWIDVWDFEHWADNYDADILVKGSGLDFYANYDKVLDMTVEKVNLGNIVELGIGTGNLAKKIISKHCDKIKYIGIDQSMNMLRQAKKKCPECEVRLGDFLRIPKGDHIADTIVTSYAFHHCNQEEKRLAISEMNRVLKNSGRIIITDLMFANKTSRYEFEYHCSTREKDDLEDEFFANVDEVEGILKSYGYRCNSEQIDDLIWMVVAER